MATIQGIYIALFGRPADPLGLDYFNSITDNGQDLSEIDSLAGQPEYLSRFEGQNNAQIVTSIYNELFGRNPDAAGLAFFTAQLNSGAQNINTIAINILDGARGADADLVEAKIAAADQFTAAVRANPDALAAYQGQSGINFGQQFLDQIDSADDELTDAQVNEQVTGFGNGDTDIPGLPGTPGNIFTLTGGNDNLAGTINNDTFRALDATSLSSSDVLNGGAGFDVLNISDGAIGSAAVGAGGVATTTATPVLQGVERINNSDAGATLNLSAASGLEQLWSSGASGTYNYTSVAASVTVGASGTDAFSGKAVDVDFAGSFSGDSDAIKLAVDDVDGAGVTFTSADAAGMEVINLAAMGDTGSDAEADVVELGAFQSIESLTVTGGGDISISGLAATMETFNASAASGDVSVSVGGEDLRNVSTGSGSDFIGVTVGQVDLTVTSGAGSDLVGVTANPFNDANDGVSTTITLGEGNDTFGLFSGGNLAEDAESVAEIEGSLITVTDFTKGEDTVAFPFSFEDFNQQAGIGSVNAAVEGADTIAEAIEALREGNFDTAQFLLGDDLYIYTTLDSEMGNAETLIQLTGVDALLTGSDFTNFA